ncbi:MAG: peroxiredoxin [Pseudomonadales bacterium]
MTLQLGAIAPDFEAETTAGKIRFHEWAQGSWVVLFSHPKDFTPVCTTELGEVARLHGEFAKRQVKVAGLSVDGLGDHHSWAEDIYETQGQQLNFPLIADPDEAIARGYEMIHELTDPKITVRTVYVIAPDHRIALTLTYPPSVGRNFDELLRVIDALQMTHGAQLATPVNWQPGEDLIIAPSVSAEQAKERFPDGWREVKPYLRYVKSGQVSAGQT